MKKNDFLSPAHEVGAGAPAHEIGAGDIVFTMSGRAAVWPCVCASVFRFRTLSLKPLVGLLSYCIQTSLRGCTDNVLARGASTRPFGRAVSKRMGRAEF